MEYNFNMNEFVFNLLGVNGVNKTVDKVTDILIAVVLAVIVAFGVTGVVQWIKRKSFKKIDAELRWMILPIVLVALVWFIFEKLVILNYRPYLVDGVAEPSFPSTHTMIAAGAMIVTMIVLPKYIKKRWLRIVLDILAGILIFAIGFGRIYAGMHWTTDVLGGLIFGADIALVYGIILKHVKEKK